jgi:hypothetical protein
MDLQEVQRTLIIWHLSKSTLLDVIHKHSKLCAYKLQFLLGMKPDNKPEQTSAI